MKKRTCPSKVVRNERKVLKGHFTNYKMGERTNLLESATRKKIDLILNNLGWNTDETSENCSVFTERVKTTEQKKKLNGKFPDYVLYKSKTDEPIAIIEAKRSGQSLKKALEQAIDLYAKPLDIKIIFVTDGTIIETFDIRSNSTLKIDEDVITDFLTEKQLLKFVEEGAFVFSPDKVAYTKRELIKIFEEADGLLRKEGLREGVERFTEFSNLLFLKLISEIEEDRDNIGEGRILEKKYCWESFYQLDAERMLEYINNIILPRLVDKYNHSGDVFQKELLIKNPENLKKIVDKLSKLKLLDTDSDIKGDAFEYFLKKAVSVGTDLGEYFTPRHIVKLIVELTDPKFQDKIYDPCCGTGGFLIEAFKHIKRKCKQTKENIEFLKEKTIYGRELTGTSKIAKMNMILAGDGHTNIINQDFLEFKKMHNNIYDVSIGNMPFGKKINEPAFVEGFLDVIKKDGYSIFIVPSGIIGTTSKRDYIKIREKLLTEGQIIKLISLPQGVFAPYTFSKTYIIFWKKGKPKENYNIEFIEIDNDGFTLNNQRDRIKGDSDIDLYFKEKNKLIEKKQIFYVNSSNIFDVNGFNENLILLSFSQEELNHNKNKISILKKQILEINDEKQKEEKQKRIIEISNKNKELIEQIKDIEKYKSNLNYSLKFSLFNSSNDKKLDGEGWMYLGGKDGVANITRGPFGSSIKKSVCVSKEEGGYKIYEQGNVINENFEIGRYYLTPEKFEELKRFEIQKDDILMTCAGTLGKIALVPETFEKGIFNSVLMRFRVDREIIRPKYLKLILESDELQRQLVKDAIGVGIKNMVPTKEIEVIKIPVPDLEKQDEIIKEMEEIEKDIQERFKKIEEIKEERNKKLNSID